MKNRLRISSSGSEGGTTVLRKTRSVDSSRNSPSENHLHKTKSEVRVHSKPVMTKTLTSNESKEGYQSVSSDLLSASPLKPSPSIMLLNRTAQVLSMTEGSNVLRRMPVETTSQVFEVRKTASKDLSKVALSRAESMLAVFKPATDEEDNLLVKSFKSFSPTAEERSLRERAAYVLDKNYGGFSRVPPTALAQIHNKNGSLQEFVASDGTAEDNPMLVGKATLEEVQRLAVLDCRIFNMDRHGGNILCQKISLGRSSPSNSREEMFTIDGFDEEEWEGGVNLIPIDHGLTLPPWTNLADCWFDWAYWPQSSEPITKSVTEYILRLDRFSDAETLKSLGIKPECIVTNTICTLVLQTFVKDSPSPVSLKTLSEFFQRPYPDGHKLHDIESPLEQIINEACLKTETQKTNVPSSKFLFMFEQVLKDHVKTDGWRSFLV